MRSHTRIGKLTALLIAATTTLAAAQEAAPRASRSRIRDQGGVPIKKSARPNAADPLAPGGAAEKEKEKGRNGQANNGGAVLGGGAAGAYHYTFRLQSFDGTPLSASYYPSKLGSTAPAVILIHEAGRSRKDFEDPVTELKGEGLAEHLQREGYAVLSMDLRGQGRNPRRARNADDREAMAEDMQAAYQFLLDRHNRGDFDIAKLGVLGIGEGANLAVGWAYQPGAAVSTEGRASDLSALVLVSPMPSGAGYALDQVLGPLALRVPLLILSGARDAASKDAVEASRQGVERARLNKIELFPSSLHGFKLLRLEPKVTTALDRFLETNLKLRPSEWEPRYNQIPVAYSDIQTVHHKPPAAPPQAIQNNNEKPKAEDKARNDDKAKAEDRAKNDDKAKGGQGRAPQ